MPPTPRAARVRNTHAKSPSQATARGLPVPFFENTGACADGVRLRSRESTCERRPNGGYRTVEPDCPRSVGIPPCPPQQPRGKVVVEHLAAALRWPHDSGPGAATTFYCTCHPHLKRLRTRATEPMPKLRCRHYLSLVTGCFVGERGGIGTVSGDAKRRGCG